MKGLLNMPEIFKTLYELVFSLHKEDIPANEQNLNMVKRIGLFNDREVTVPQGLLSSCYYFRELDLSKK